MNTLSKFFWSVLWCKRIPYIFFWMVLVLYVHVFFKKFHPICLFNLYSLYAVERISCNRLTIKDAKYFCHGLIHTLEWKMRILKGELHNY